MCVCSSNYIDLCVVHGSLGILALPFPRLHLDIKVICQLATFYSGSETGCKAFLPPLWATGHNLVGLVWNNRL